MKRYAAFAGMNYATEDALSYLKGSFDDPIQARAHVEGLDANWWRVLDTETGRDVVYQNQAIIRALVIR